MPFRIGIDFGGVLSTPDEHNIVNGQVAEHTNTAIDILGAIETLRQLKADGHELYIISFCGKRRAIETSASLSMTTDSNGQPLFHGQFYVKNYKYKHPICNFLGCHFMIDDLPEVLDRFFCYPPRTKTILFLDQHTVADSDPRSANKTHQIARNWNEVYSIISNTQYFPVEPQKINNIEKIMYIIS